MAAWLFPPSASPSMLTNLHLGPFCVGHSPLLHSETAGAAGRSGQGVMCRIVHSHLAREGERMLTALSWHNRGCCASFPLSAWLLHMVSLAWWLQRSQSSYKSVLDSRGIRKKSKPSKSCIAPDSPGEPGMQPRDPCLPWRGILGPGHTPR